MACPSCDVGTSSRSPGALTLSQSHQSSLKELDHVEYDD
jgi:hypothetical protein